MVHMSFEPILNDKPPLVVDLSHFHVLNQSMSCNSKAEPDHDWLHMKSILRG